MPEAKTTLPPLRMKVINPAAIAHVMEHPAREKRWSVRELAPRLGCSAATLSHMRTGARATVPAELAERFAEAVGVETAVLFAPSVSSDSDGRAAS
jgi:DNA-binding Xre family transcriptional regulator